MSFAVLIVAVSCKEPPPSQAARLLLPTASFRLCRRWLRIRPVARRRPAEAHLLHLGPIRGLSCSENRLAHLRQQRSQNSKLLTLRCAACPPATSVPGCFRQIFTRSTATSAPVIQPRFTVHGISFPGTAPICITSSEFWDRW